MRDGARDLRHDKGSQRSKGLHGQHRDFHFTLQQDNVPVRVPLKEATLQDYIDHPEDYAPRAHPENLKWGLPLDADELAVLSKIRKTRIHNRVTIPGDKDYKGVFSETESLCE